MSRKNELTFQQKFKDRMDNMGKDGIHGLVKQISKSPTNKRELENIKESNNKGILNKN